MPAKNPRVNVVLEKPLYDDVRKLARRDGVSLSLKVRDLVKVALERNENYGLASVARERAPTVWRYLGTGKRPAWPERVDWANDPITKLVGEIRSGKLTGSGRTGPRDGAVEHDHYIYGVPKLKDRKQ